MTSSRSKSSRVDYELTSLGATLLGTIQPLVAWTRAHSADIAAARRAYDTRTDELPEPLNPPSSAVMR